MHLVFDRECSLCKKERLILITFALCDDCDPAYSGVCEYCLREAMTMVRQATMEAIYNALHGEGDVQPRILSHGRMGTEDA